MAHLRRSGFRTSGGQRRKTTWTGGPSSGVDGGPQDVSTSSSVLGTTASLVAEDGITVVRIRGDLSIFLMTAAAAGDGYHGAVGIGIASAAAITAGVASLPTPITEESDPNWMYHRYFSVLAGGVIDNSAAADADQVNATSAAMHFEMDSKAMRKLSIGQGLYFAVESVEFGAAAVMRFAFNCRLLIKLP